MLNRPPQFHARFSRWLGLLLIAFILYGTTVEAAHRHGRVLTDNSDVTSLSPSEKSGSLTGTQSGCSDCLICQLHQHLNTTLITYRLVNPPQQLQLGIPVTVPRDVLSHRGRATAGRAPPSIS